MWKNPNLICGMDFKCAFFGGRMILKERWPTHNWNSRKSSLKIVKLFTGFIYHLQKLRHVNFFKN